MKLSSGHGFPPGMAILSTSYRLTDDQYLVITGNEPAVCIHSDVKGINFVSCRYIGHYEKSYGNVLLLWIQGRRRTTGASDGKGFAQAGSGLVLRPRSGLGWMRRSPKGRPWTPPRSGLCGSRKSGNSISTSGCSFVGFVGMPLDIR